MSNRETKVEEKLIDRDRILKVYEQKTATNYIKTNYNLLQYDMVGEKTEGTYPGIPKTQ